MGIKTLAGSHRSEAQKQKKQSTQHAGLVRPLPRHPLRGEAQRRENRSRRRDPDIVLFLHFSKDALNALEENLAREDTKSTLQS